MEAELKRLADELGIADVVTLLGYQTNPYKYVAKCDLFVCASFAEGFSTAATEALIVGTPVCTVEVSGMKEMLGENNEWGVSRKMMMRLCIMASSSSWMSLPCWPTRHRLNSNTSICTE